MTPWAAAYRAPPSMGFSELEREGFTGGVGKADGRGTLTFNPCNNSLTALRKQLGEKEAEDKRASQLLLKNKQTTTKNKTS